MKVLVLTSGRTGSMSLFHACQHIENFTAGHDSKSGLLAAERVQVKQHHIEIDTRFAWFLGRIAAQDDGDTYYVHLKRNRSEVAASYNNRWANRKGIMRGYCEGILERDKHPSDISIAEDLVETVEQNIQEFLVNRPHSTISLETSTYDLNKFFDSIGAQVDREKALDAFGQRANHSRRVSLFARLRLRLSQAADELERKLMTFRSRS